MNNINQTESIKNTVTPPTVVGGGHGALEVPDSSDENQRSDSLIRVVPERILFTLLLITFAMVIVGTFARIGIYTIAPDFGQAQSQPPAITKVLARLDLGHEPSLPQLYSSFILAGCSILLAVIAITRSGKERKGWFSPWWLLSIIFLLMSIDESIMIHEMLNRALEGFVHTQGALRYPWIIVGALFTGCVAIALLPFLVRLDYRTRQLFLLSGFIFVGGAIGIEIIEGFITDQFGVTSLQMTLAIAVEEGCEMVGVCLFLYSLIDYLKRDFNTLHIQAYSVSNRTTEVIS